MITLQGKNLCERQKELNFKVKEAFKNNVDFKKVKSGQESSDVDRLFKIDLASQYRNIDYIIEELKCGDPLYISRALKCEWIYDNNYAHIINPDYLHHNIFPTMSFKMKTKTLSAISMYVRDELRAQLFFDYCKSTNMKNSALKVLVFTSESNKQDFLSNNDNYSHITDLKNVVGNSFVLADIYCEQGGKISDLSYLYSVNDVEYLNLVEKYTKSDYYYYKNISFGSKMSRDIIKKHKSRILINPEPYLKILKKSELTKYTSPDDARVMAAAVLPKDVVKFWRNDYYESYKHVLDLVKPSIYEFMKEIFTNKYPAEEFEMSMNFYKLKYYNFMSVQEKETWALKHLELQNGVISEYDDYQWYEYVKFPLAFNEIKKKVVITTQCEKRTEMLNTLVKSAKTQRELEELLNYYYKRHVNEREDQKIQFLVHVIDNHKVLEFDDACWSAFDKLLHSMKVYIAESWRNEQFRDLSLIYHIINKKTIPNGLHKHLNKFTQYQVKHFADQLKEKSASLYDYFNQYHMDQIKSFESVEYTKEVSEKVRDHLQKLIELKQTFKNEEAYPDIALKFMNLDFDNFKHTLKLNHKMDIQEPVITEGFLIRCLKQDPNVIIEKFSSIEEKCNSSYDFRLNMLLKKMKVYFANDIAKQFLDLCATSLLSAEKEDSRHALFSRRSIFQNIFTIFQLGDDRLKAELMEKYAPESAKIEHDKISELVCYVQEAICRFHCYSRPPVPLSKTALYLKGDYVHMCNDLFHMYLRNLIPQLRTEFVNFLLDSPVSTQKRGLRLAFQTFKTSELKDLVTNVWRKTKNVSLRSNLYKLILEKMVEEKEKSQMELFEVLKELTKHIHQDDAEEIFEYFRGRQIPEHLRGSYLETAWNTVSTLPVKKSNIQRRITVVKEMKSNMDIMDDSIVETLVNDHIQKVLMEQKLKPEPNGDIVELNDALWDFVAKYIMTISTELSQEKRLNILKVIVTECFNNWNETQDTDIFVIQLFFKTFTGRLEDDFLNPRVSFVFEYLLEAFEKQFGVREMYSYYWDWNLSLISRKVIENRELCDRDVHIRFGAELGLFVKQLKENHNYYVSFLGKILGKIKKHIRILINMERKSLTDIYVKILIAYGLTKQEMVETYFLALEILPEDLSELPDESELREVIEAVKKQNNDELTALLNDKFIYSDLKVRKVLF